MKYLLDTHTLTHFQRKLFQLHFKPLSKTLYTRQPRVIQLSIFQLNFHPQAR